MLILFFKTGKRQENTTMTGAIEGRPEAKERKSCLLRCFILSKLKIVLLFWPKWWKQLWKMIWYLLGYAYAYYCSDISRCSWLVCYRWELHDTLWYKLVIQCQVWNEWNSVQIELLLLIHFQKISNSMIHEKNDKNGPYIYIKVAAPQLHIARSFFPKCFYDVPESTHYVQLNRIVKGGISFHQSDHFASA